MKLSAFCMYCLVKKQEEVIRNFLDEEKKANYMKKVLEIIAAADESATAPVISCELNKWHQEYWGTSNSYSKEKEEYNYLMLQKERDIESHIYNSENRLLTALKFARVGNYIDFGVIDKVDNQKYEQLLKSAISEDIDTGVYDTFLGELKNSKSLIYITDNCGEIVLDKIFIKEIRNEYPNIDIKVIVRGKPVLNDATKEDADMVGLTEIVPVIGNGTEIAGTQLDKVDPNVKQMITTADIIISKGQGNFETLHGSGLNIYYLFLCKCDWFVNRFHLEKFKGVFINEKNIIF